MTYIFVALISIIGSLTAIRLFRGSGTGVADYQSAYQTAPVLLDTATRTAIGSHVAHWEAPKVNMSLTMSPSGDHTFIAHGDAGAVYQIVQLLSQRNVGALPYVMDNGYGQPEIRVIPPYQIPPPPPPLRGTSAYGYGRSGHPHPR
ncbi:hypothetical protein [Herbidospora mongoliensis]|uniref:hypothetical protein n=1 Tax=Herbidospora mongoliensis TaxID=688067 RepID=UPI000A57CF99|nr:hypothetical protein [Herbidospora mongoliensis]